VFFVSRGSSTIKNVPDARNTTLQPFEKKYHPLSDNDCQYCFNPMNNGDVIIISVPALTEE
jgi:ribosome recycling factor